MKLARAIRKYSWKRKGCDMSGRLRASFRFGAAAVVLLVPPSVVIAQTAQPTMHCWQNSSIKMPKAQRQTLKALQDYAESSPLYRELVSKTGKPQACKVTWTDQHMALSYLFNEQARLQVTTDPTIEYTEESAKLSTPITEEEALALLKAAAKHSFAAFGENDCGIEWNKPSDGKPTASGSHEVSYWGGTCNCQARKVYQEHRITGLIVSSAC